mmetsp:Transcript_81371/g.215966  ORF Transcript_81371/g.215966 Transcript_81371/m.215966 type:complete len:218 (-) Transcript_81371:1477-2130(-)
MHVGVASSHQRVCQAHAACPLTRRPTADGDRTCLTSMLPVLEHMLRRKVVGSLRGLAASRGCPWADKGTCLHTTFQEPGQTWHFPTREVYPQKIRFLSLSTGGDLWKTSRPKGLGLQAQPRPTGPCPALPCAVKSPRGRRRGSGVPRGRQSTRVTARMSRRCHHSFQAEAVLLPAVRSRSHLLQWPVAVLSTLHRCDRSRSQRAASGLHSSMYLQQV